MLPVSKERNRSLWSRPFECRSCGYFKVRVSVSYLSTEFSQLCVLPIMITSSELKCCFSLSTVLNTIRLRSCSAQRAQMRARVSKLIARDVSNISNSKI